MRASQKRFIALMLSLVLTLSLVCTLAEQRVYAARHGEPPARYISRTGYVAVYQRLALTVLSLFILYPLLSRYIIAVVSRGRVKG